MPLWEKPLSASTDLLDVGLRSSLVASYYAAPLLVETGRGLVVFTSAPGAVRYQYGAAYGAHKASLDKFAASDPHRDIIRRLRPRMSPTRFEFFPISGADLPLTWAQITARVS